MSEQAPDRMAEEVRARARQLCEYCRMPQWSQEASFHIDHIQARADGGETTLENLALACVTCSLKKGSRQFALDPKSNRRVRLFHPRFDNWRQHFRWDREWRVIGRTPIGRASARALGMNRPAVIMIRQLWARLGLFPTDRGDSAQ